MRSSPIEWTKSWENSNRTLNYHTREIIKGTPINLKLKKNEMKTKGKKILNLHWSEFCCFGGILDLSNIIMLIITDSFHQKCWPLSNFKKVPMYWPPGITHSGHNITQQINQTLISMNENRISLWFLGLPFTYTVILQQSPFMVGIRSTMDVEYQMFNHLNSSPYQSIWDWSFM